MTQRNRTYHSCVTRHWTRVNFSAYNISVTFPLLTLMFHGIVNHPAVWIRRDVSSGCTRWAQCIRWVSAVDDYGNSCHSLSSQLSVYVSWSWLLNGIWLISLGQLWWEHWFQGQRWKQESCSATCKCGVEKFRGRLGNCSGQKGIISISLFKLDS